GRAVRAFLHHPGAPGHKNVHLACAAPPLLPGIPPQHSTRTDFLNLSFIGLGVMGFPMAGHLAKAGHAVTVYNRTAAKAEAWVAKFGGRSAATPVEAARGADIVFACVGNDDDLRQVTTGAHGAFSGMSAGTIFVDHTTASAGVARELAAAARKHDITFLDAPVSDRKS